MANVPPWLMKLVVPVFPLPIPPPQAVEGTRARYASFTLNLHSHAKHGNDQKTLPQLTGFFKVRLSDEGSRNVFSVRPAPKR